VPGASLGILLACALVRAVPAFGPTGLPFPDGLTIDRGILGFATALALLTGLGLGLWPAREAGRIAVIGSLNESARTAPGGHSRTRARRMLVAAEVSLSLVLLVCAALLVLSLQRLQRVDPGFEPGQLFTATVSLPPARYGDAERVARFVQSVTDEIAALPGIGAAGTTTTLPLGGYEWGKFFSIDGRPAPQSLAQVPSVNYRQVTPRYLQTMGATLRRGRLFSDEDRPGHPLVVIVNETLARRFWPNQDPIGQRVSMSPSEPLLPAALFPAGVTRLPYRTVVGVVQDFRQAGLDARPTPEVFVPVAQLPFDVPSRPTRSVASRSQGSVP
jgi:putative ABC transport system permease protein